MEQVKSRMVDGDELRVRPARSALRRIQELVAAHAVAPGEPLASEELLADRRREAAE